MNTIKNNLILITLSPVLLLSQVKISDTNNSEINSNAILHLETYNKNKGFLISRVNLDKTTNATPLSNHTNGIIVYNLATTNGDNSVTPGIYINDGTKWCKLTTGQINYGDIKHSFNSIDHDGWYLLNGRAISSLSISAQQIATSLGITGNLPNASDRLLKNSSVSENTLISNGSDSFTILTTNLPNVNFNGSTTMDGLHSHTYLDNPTNSTLVVSGANNPISNTESITRATSTSGTHTHTISFTLGGNSQPIPYKPKSINTNIFIYLGKN